MAFEWRLRPFDGDRVVSLSKATGVEPIVAQLLLNRGVTEPAQAQAFLDPRRDGLHDPESLPGVADAASRIVRAIEQGRKIVVYGDYDVDGVCGTSVLWECLRLAGAKNAEYYIPNRIDEGYGVNADALRRLRNEQNADLVVTVDCGISAVAEARLAREIGLELIITDHHHIGAELPEPDALVHPRLPGSRYPFPDLCGCAVAFKLAWQVCKSFGDGKRSSPHLREFLVNALNLVALATIADVMPLAGENRIFVRHGLRGLATKPSVGLRALMQVSNMPAGGKLGTGAVNFKLAPRINAAGRLACASKAVELLTTSDPARATELARTLDDCNRRRQEVERTIIEEARALLDEQGGTRDRASIVVGKADWHPGVVGIVASRLVDFYHRPAIVIALNEPLSQGSARSIPGFHLYDAIAACADELVSFGGHAAAAGLRLTPDKLKTFAERFEAHCRTLLDPATLRKTLHIDAEVPLGLLTFSIVDAIANLEPFGIGNPRPILAANDVEVVGDARVMGEKQNHLNVRLGQGRQSFKAVGWNMAARAAELSPGTRCSIAFEPIINEWNGRRAVELELKELRLAREAHDVAPA